MNAIITYNKDDSKDDAKGDEEHAHNEEEADVKDNSGDDPASEPAKDTNFARHISRIWLDVHSIIPRTDDGLFIPGMPMDPDDVDGDIVISQKRSHTRDDEDHADTPGPSKALCSSKKQQSARDGNSQGTTDAFEKRRPDLVLVDHSTQELRHHQCLWRHIAVLLEVKRDRKNRPNPANGTALTATVAQLADMARLVRTRLHLISFHFYITFDFYLTLLLANPVPRYSILLLYHKPPAAHAEQNSKRAITYYSNAKSTKSTGI